jgi:hypothetical protein
MAVVVGVAGAVLVVVPPPVTPVLAPELAPEPPPQFGWSFGQTGGLASTVPDPTVVTVSSWQLEPFGQSAVVLHCCAALAPCSASTHAADVKPRRIVLRVVMRLLEASR